MVDHDENEIGADSIPLKMSANLSPKFTPGLENWKAKCIPICHTTCQKCDDTKCIHCKDGLISSLSKPKQCIEFPKDYLEVIKIAKTEGYGNNPQLLRIETTFEYPVREGFETSIITLTYFETKSGSEIEFYPEVQDLKIKFSQNRKILTFDLKFSEKQLGITIKINLGEDFSTESMKLPLLSKHSEFNSNEQRMGILQLQNPSIIIKDISLYFENDAITIKAAVGASRNTVTTATAVVLVSNPMAAVQTVKLL